MITLSVPDKTELDIKRLYLPITIKGPCAHCGEEVRVDLEKNAIYYPTIGFPEKVHVNCEACDQDSDFTITLHVSLDMLPPEKKQED